MKKIFTLAFALLTLSAFTQNGFSIFSSAEQEFYNSTDFAENSGLNTNIDYASNNQFIFSFKDGILVHSIVSDTKGIEETQIYKIIQHDKNYESGLISHIITVESGKTGSKYLYLIFTDMDYNIVTFLQVVIMDDLDRISGIKYKDIKQLVLSSYNQ